MAERVTEDRLKALVADEIRQSRAHDDAELRGKRTTALDYYLGNMSDIQAEVGRSSAVSRDVADTVGWMLPGIIRVFTASDRMAVAEPVGPEDEKWAEQVTEGVNHVFWKENEGYKILYSATWDSLVLKNGIIKHTWDDTPDEKVTTHSGLDDDAFAMLTQDDDIDVLAHTANEEEVLAPDHMTGEMMQTTVTTHDVKIRRTIEGGRIRIECIPPEDFLLDKNATCIEEARFVGHTQRKTRSDLIEMGFDRKKVESLSAGPDRGEEKLIRESDEDNYAGTNEMTPVDLTECYIRVDMDGDGVAELVRCFYAGARDSGELLDWEVWDDDVAFSDIPCNPLPHRFDAESIADETMDVQRIKTVLLRQSLDNIYATNIPRQFVTGEIINPEELYSPSFGGVVFGKPGATMVPMNVPFVADKALDGIAYQDQVIERRTGVSRSTMALDPEALTNQTATAVQAQKDASYSQVELVARNQAELGWKKVFRAILRLMVKHQDKPKTIRLRNEWVEIDPRSWNADMDITINVGLGTGSRDRDMAMLNTLLMNQGMLADRLTNGGMGDIAIKLLPKVRNTLVKLTEAAGIRSPQDYFPEFTDQDAEALAKRISEQQSQPDPKLQAEMAKTQADQQSEATKFQFEQQKAAAQMQADMQRMQMEHQLKREQLDAEMMLKREQLSAELELKRELAIMDMRMKREVGMMGHAMKAETANATSGVHVGGEPG